MPLKMKYEATEAPRVKRNPNHGDLSALRNIILGAAYTALSVTGEQRELEEQFKYITKTYFGWTDSSNRNTSKEFLLDIMFHLSEMLGVPPVDPGEGEAKLGQIEVHIEKILDIINEEDEG